MRTKNKPDPRFLAYHTGLGMSFVEVLTESTANLELVKEFERLTGNTLILTGAKTPLDRMIDEACGPDPKALKEWIDFVWEFIFTRVQVEGNIVPIHPELAATGLHS